MPDLDPAIWENKTLGEVTTNENLDRVTKQELENRSAKLEGREPRNVVVENTYPDWTPPVNERTGTVPSNYMHVHFEGENPNDVIQADEGIKPEGISDEEWNGEQTEGSSVETEDETATTEPDSTEETKWQ